MSGDPAGGAGAGYPGDSGLTADLRQQMVKFATLQLGDASLAEDAVQEALVSALASTSAFRGAAALRTWVFAILKNKIADTLRQRRRLVFAGTLPTSGGDDDEEGDIAPSVFDSRGHWQLSEQPVDWGDPEASFRQQDFWRVFSACLDGLPPRQARVLMMREFIELDAEEICTSVGMTATNLHVTLHRARLRLRECLEDHWFDKGDRT